MKFNTIKQLFDIFNMQYKDLTLEEFKRIAFILFSVHPAYQQDILVKLLAMEKHQLLAFIDCGILLLNHNRLSNKDMEILFSLVHAALDFSLLCRALKLFSHCPVQLHHIEAIFVRKEVDPEKLVQRLEQISNSKNYKSLHPQELWYVWHNLLSEATHNKEQKCKIKR